MSNSIYNFLTENQGYLITELFKDRKYAFDERNKLEDCHKSSQPYIDKLVMVFGELYLYIGVCEEFEDNYWLLLDRDGIIHYHSCVGSITPLTNLSKKSYNALLLEFTNNLSIQRQWRMTFDNRCFIPIPDDKYEINYYIDNNIPVITKYRKNTKDIKSQKLSKDEKKKLRSNFRRLLMHFLGFHYIVNKTYICNEVESLRNDSDIIDEVVMGRCEVCDKWIVLNRYNESISGKRPSILKRFMDKVMFSKNKIYRPIAKVIKPLYMFNQYYKRAK